MVADSLDKIRGLEDEFSLQIPLTLTQGIYFHPGTHLGGALPLRVLRQKYPEDVGAENVDRRHEGLDSG